jgi:two-component system sensor kinase FixL
MTSDPVRTLSAVETALGNLLNASRPKAWSGPALAYAAVLGAAALACAMAATLRADFPGSVFLLFVPVVLAASFFAGAGPGLIATALGGFAGVALRPGDGAGYDALCTLFIVVGVLASAGGEWAMRTRRRGAQAVQDLSEREAHMRSIYDTAPDAMIVIDEHGIVQTYSAAAERIFVWAAADVLGRNVSMLMPAPYRGEHDGYVRHYLDTGEKRIIGIGRIVTGERKDGATFPMELNVGEVRTPHGRFFTGFVRDLTERQETEARLQELQSELIHISRLSAMGEMASALAHELNQPLSANANYLSGARRMLDSGELDVDRLREALTKATEQALRAGEIIRRLRDFLARGEGERSVESLSKLVREACALALVGAKEDNVRIKYQLDPRAEQVLVDRVQVQQVLLNLVRNALDAMRDYEGRRELVVSTGLHDDDMAILSVIDSGPGLAPETAARLFQPFVTTKAQGMGVGLSISRNIVEAHGGRIWTEPNPSGGAIFRFTLRLAQANNGRERQQ